MNPKWLFTTGGVVISHHQRTWTVLIAVTAYQGPPCSECTIGGWLDCNMLACWGTSSNVKGALQISEFQQKSLNQELCSTLIFLTDRHCVVIIICLLVVVIDCIIKNNYIYISETGPSRILATGLAQVATCFTSNGLRPR